MDVHTVSFTDETAWGKELGPACTTSMCQWVSAHSPENATLPELNAVVPACSQWHILSNAGTR